MLTWIISTAQQARPKVIHHKRPGARPGEQIFGRGDEEALLVELLAQPLELGPVGVAGDQPGEPRQLLLGRHPVVPGVERHSHSSAPFFHA